MDLRHPVRAGMEIALVNTFGKRRAGDADLRRFAC